MPHPSAAAPCQVSIQVSDPTTFWNEPSVLNIYSSSNKHALVVTSSEVFDHQEILSNSGPTPSAPASGANFQVPSTPSGITSFTSLNDQ